MNIQKLVYMANQIGKFFAAQGEDAAITGVADHLRKFWDPRMRTQIIAHYETGGDGLEAHVRAAIARLAENSRP
jgi:formate dehydrogenase subunit delta